MDNLTHSLIGATVAEVAFQIQRVRTPSVRRAPIYSASIMANNFPDLDLFQRLLEPSSLGYLLNHRGYTHTFAFSPPQILLILCALWVWQKCLGQNLSRMAWGALAAVTSLGLLLHIGMDSLNSYGIHPLSPFNNGWLYGDTLFIVEPWFWAFSIPLALTASPKWGLGPIVAVFALIGLASGVRMGMLHIGLSIFLIASASGFFLFLRGKSAGFRPWATVVALFMVVTVFAGMREWTKSVLINAFAPQPGFAIRDLVLSPLPGNPLCWTYLAVEQSASRYRVASGFVDFLRLGCGADVALEGLGLMAAKAGEFAGDKRVRELGAYDTETKELVSEISTHCRVQAWFQFARVPQREGTVYNDLRYAIRSKHNFSTYDSSQNSAQDCMVYSVPWTPPLWDRLTAAP